MKFSLCIEPIFGDVPFYERFRIAKDLGCDAVEFWDPWTREDVTPAGLGKASADAGIPIAACCLNKSSTYRMSLPWDVLKKNVELSMSYAAEMGTGTLIGLAGQVFGRTDGEQILLTENLKRTAEIAEKHGVTVVLEALNSTYDHKGYYLDSSYVGFAICRAVGSPGIKLLYDCYHMQLMEGNIVNQIRENIDLIGHFHSAGVPGRHELHLGEINYPFVIKAAEEAGYDKYFGFEYFPTYDDRQSLADTLAHVRRS